MVQDRVATNNESGSTGPGTTLLDLQWYQLKHDEKYHRDILALSVADRLKHMTLHFAKYVGVIADNLDEDGGSWLERVLVDGFIIGLASANSLNMNLDIEIGGSVGAKSLRELGAEWFSAQSRRAGDQHALFRAAAKATGIMAKACESLDHLEDFPFKPTIKANVITLVKLIVAEAATRGLDIEMLMKRRLDSVERANFLYQKHPR